MKLKTNDVVWLRNKPEVLSPCVIRSVVCDDDDDFQDENQLLYAVEYLPSPDAEEAVIDLFREEDLALYVPRKELMDLFLKERNLYIAPIPPPDPAFQDAYRAARNAVQEVTRRRPLTQSESQSRSVPYNPRNPSQNQNTTQEPFNRGRNASGEFLAVKAEEHPQVSRRPVSAA